MLLRLLRPECKSIVVESAHRYWQLTLYHMIKNITLSILKVFADDNLNVGQMIKFDSDEVKHCWKERIYPFSDSVFYNFDYLNNILFVVCKCFQQV